MSKVFYEERVINGRLCWRETPDGKWIECTKEQLTTRVEEMKLIAPKELYEKAPWWANPDLPLPKVTF